MSKQIAVLKLSVILSVITILFGSGCANDNADEVALPTRKLYKVSPATVQVGDTVTIDGIGLLCPKCHITFNGADNYDVIASNDRQFVTTVPEPYNENVSVVLWEENKPLDTVIINLVGFFRLGTLPYGPREVQSFDEQTFFASAESGLFSTEDGGYTWSQLFSSELGVRRFFFLTEKVGWVLAAIRTENSSSTHSDYVVYYTGNSGKTFQPIDTVTSHGFLEDIEDIVFTSPTEGYLLSNHGKIYRTINNGQFEKIYDFPEDASISGFRSLSVYQNTVMATGGAEIGLSSNVPILIIGKSGVFSYRALDGSLGTIQLINDYDAYLVKGNKLFFSDDSGENWVKQNDLVVYDFIFSDKSNGFAITSGRDEYDRTIAFTHDNGLNWQLNARRPTRVTSAAFYGNIGLIGSNNQLWRYIRR